MNPNYPREKEVWQAWAKVYNSFFARFRGAYLQHFLLFCREAAEIAGIPSETVHLARFGLLDVGHDQRFLAAVPRILERISSVRANGERVPVWAQNHRTAPRVLGRMATACGGR